MPGIGFVIEGDGRTSISEGRLPIDRAAGPQVLEHLGRTVLFCWRRTPGRLVFFARATAMAITALEGGEGYAVQFSETRLLRQHVPMTLEHRGETGAILPLSESDIAEILAGAGETGAAWGFSEAEQDLFISEAPAIGFGRAAVKRQVLEGFANRCALTGEAEGYEDRAPDTLDVVPIRPEAEGGLFSPPNLLAMTRRASRAWTMGLISVAPGGFLAISPFLGDGELAAQLNPSGRIRMPAAPDLQPDRQALLYHYLFVFQQRFGAA